MYININLPIERGSLISEIRSLPKITSLSKKKKEKEVESEPLLLASVGKKGKKKDKKKKKKLEMEFLDANSEESSSLDFYASNEMTEGDDKLIDIDAILNRDEEEDDDGISGPIIDGQRKSYEKRKKDENPFKKEFAEELTLLYDLLDEMNKFSKELDKKYKSLENSKVRGVSKYTNDMVINMLNAKSSKLQIVKEINSLKKVIADLKIKQDGKKGANGEEAGADHIAAQYFQKVLKHGRNNFIKQFGGDNDVEDDVDDVIADIERAKQGYNPHEEETFQSLIRDRLEDEENPFRTDNGSKYIEYENRGVKINIKKCVDNGDWEFVAIDRDGMQIFDYPLPNKREVGKVKFNDNYATDERGRSYNVIEYFLPEDEY